MARPRSEKLPEGSLIGRSERGTDLKRIIVGSSSESSHISAQREYKVRIGPRWYEGRFSKRWFGWLFENFGDTGMQLNLIDEIFEIPRTVGRKVRRPSPEVRPLSKPGGGDASGPLA
jgi:hypothetical protein